MIISIIIILIALYWLLRETDYLRVRLLTGKDKPVESERDNLKMLSSGKSEVGYIPTEFTPLDMPELKGTLNFTHYRICEI